MTLTVVTGPARSGKSTLGQWLAQRSPAHVTVVVAGRTDDAEMEGRIARHRAERPEGWATLEITPAMLADDVAGWLAEIPAGDTLLLDCLGTLLGALLESRLAAPMDEAAVADRDLEGRFEAAAGVVARALADRSADTIVVSNETAWGVVPAHASGRLHRDVLGRATRTLVDASDNAWLVVAGRAIDLTSLPRVEEI